MPLHHWPNPRVSWKSFHHLWIAQLVEHLNQELLPAGFQARPTELIVGIEPDVLLLQESDRPAAASTKPQPALAEATLTALLPPPAELPLVGIYSAYDTQHLVSAIELVSPGNKDRPEAVQAFIEKALFLLQEGVHLMIVDVISLPHRPIRQALLKRLELAEPVDESRLWVSSYCALPGEDPQPHLEVREWAHGLAVGASLPALPLFLRSDQLWVTVDLEASYQATLHAGRYKPA
jgi:hypothetical protein